MIVMDGILLIDKPAGLTSHDVVARVRRILGVRRVGHTGTLDPFATGLLVIMVGRATRLAQFLSGAEKEYEATIRFGFATDTGDLTGTPSKTADHPSKQVADIKPEDIEAALASLRGRIEQTPPMYSAKKIKGRKLYELARRGEEIERSSVCVNVTTFEASQPPQFNDDGTLDVPVRVVCSAGTYVRTLAESAGNFLGAGAHLATLRRTRAGQFSIERALTLTTLEQLVSVGDPPEGFLISPAEAISHLPAVTLDAEQARRTANGMSLPIAASSIGWERRQQVRMLDARSNLLAVASFDEVKELLQPTVVMTSQ
ncbi:MAG: tRNA pseudouridine55 synthase [Blastocatellia bacterium]|jgi:tRNA pseudouridine55 synthase|nr:tRNA pseudouridine55 synthase [Blastocatellia bacterium]